MKTIEVNLIGDLKQKTPTGKIGSIAAPIAGKSDKPEDQRNNMILFGVAGSGILALGLIVLLLIISFVGGIFIDSQIADTNNKIEEQNALLAKYTKMQQRLLDQKKDLIVKQKIKKYLETKKFPMEFVLEELRAKIPNDIRLTEVKKAKAGIIVKGAVARESQEPLRSITRFIVNINTLFPEVSIIDNAFLASVNEKEGSYEFSIKAGYKGLESKKK